MKAEEEIPRNKKGPLYYEMVLALDNLSKNYFENIPQNIINLEVEKKKAIAPVVNNGFLIQ